MADFHDLHPVADDTIPHEIRTDVDQLTKAVAQRSAAVRMVAQLLTGIEEAQPQQLRRQWIVGGHIGLDPVEVAKRPSRPDYSSHSLGIGVRGSLPHVASHLATSL